MGIFWIGGVGVGFVVIVDVNHNNSIFLWYIYRPDMTVMVDCA